MGNHIDNSNQFLSGRKITRKEALSTAGKYAAFTAASMMLILKPANAEDTVSLQGLSSTEATEYTEPLVY